MNINQFTPKMPGELIPIEEIRGATHAFLPATLPPTWTWPEDLWPILMDANIELARLDGIGRHLPDPSLLLRPLEKREAQRSSKIEGTFPNPQQQLLFELDPIMPEASDDTASAHREVSNYGIALHRGLQLLNDQVPFSQWFIRELHRILMNGVRGSDPNPGSFRTYLVQIGRPPRFIPPPPIYLSGALGSFEKVARSEHRMFDPLVDAFLMHYQFEAIHPFGDGNGRVGRLLLALMITRWCRLSNQWLYMSAYFDDNKDEYMERLLRVSTHNDWHGWIRFCLIGVSEQARDTQRRCERLLELAADYKERVKLLAGSWRLQGIVDNLFLVPAVRIPMLADEHDVSYPTARSDVEKLMSVGILHEIDNVSPKTFYAPEILQITLD